MNTLILIIDSDSDWSPRNWIAMEGGTKMPNGQMTLERQKEWLSITLDDCLLSDFESSEKEFFARHIAKPTAFLVEWKESALIEAFLRSIPSECTAFIDNDHGLIAPVQSIRDLPVDSWRTSALPPYAVS